MTGDRLGPHDLVAWIENPSTGRRTPTVGVEWELMSQAGVGIAETLDTWIEDALRRGPLPHGGAWHVRVAPRGTLSRPR